MQNSSKTAIYFCGSIRAGRQDVDLYQRIIGVARDMFSGIPNLQINDFFFTKNVLFSFEGFAKCLFCKNKHFYVNFISIGNSTSF